MPALTGHTFKDSCKHVFAMNKLAKTEYTRIWNLAFRKGLRDQKQLQYAVESTLAVFKQFGNWTVSGRVIKDISKLLSYGSSSKAHISEEARTSEEVNDELGTRTVGLVAHAEQTACVIL